MHDPAFQPTSGQLLPCTSGPALPKGGYVTLLGRAGNSKIVNIILRVRADGCPLYWPCPDWMLFNLTKAVSIPHKKASSDSMRVVHLRQSTKCPRFVFPAGQIGLVRLGNCHWSRLTHQNIPKAMRRGPH